MLNAPASHKHRHSSVVQQRTPIDLPQCIALADETPGQRQHMAGHSFGVQPGFVLPEVQRLHQGFGNAGVIDVYPLRTVIVWRLRPDLHRHLAMQLANARFSSAALPVVISESAPGAPSSFPV